MARLGSHGTSSETGAVGLNKGGKKVPCEACNLADKVRLVGTE